MLELLSMFAIFLVATSYIWYPYCCDCLDVTEPCTNCDTDTTPTTITVTLGGWGDDNCDCSFANDSFVCPQNGSNSCEWHFIDTPHDCSPLNDCIWSVLVRALYFPGIGHGAGWKVEAGAGTAVINGGQPDRVLCEYEWHSGTSTFDCSDPRTLTQTYASGYGSTYAACDDPTGTTCSIVPSLT